ncbi:MAG: lysine--tRNA ligase [Janthinobacterium lividum]
MPKAWPFEEAARLAGRVGGERPALFETGYGPSGLPHIGTFGEVARTSWVRRAYEELTGRPTRLLAFSDDMDGLRKVPDNVPNREMLAGFLGRPLTRVPDPFGTHESFGAHNNARLRAFLDAFGFEYEFASASEYYASGRFDAGLRRVLECHDEIVAAVGPTLGAERRATYSPVLPVHPRTGVVMQVAIEAVDAGAATVVWSDGGERFETSVLGGAAKMQWKADWAMRWFALGVDYEMSGKDLIDSVKLSGRICRILGAEPPVGYTYELFLDEHAQKISKSKGNGLSVEEWLRYAPAESLSQFMFNTPQRAKRLYFDVIPRAVDDYVANVAKARAMAEDPAQGDALLANPAWHIHGGRVGQGAGAPVGFAMLLNLAGVVNADEPSLLWGFLGRYGVEGGPERNPFLARLVEHAVAYHRDFVRPGKRYRAPDANERAALADLAETLRGMEPGTRDAEAVQDVVFAVGKRHDFPELRAWFGCLYQVLLGQQEGPRFGVFAALYGVGETVALIEGALARPDPAAGAGEGAGG